MAVDLPTRRPAKLSASSIAIAGRPPPALGARTGARKAPAWPRPLTRLLEMLPGATALFLISTLVWGYVWFPHELAIGLLLFDVYWLWKSWTIAYHVVKGVRIMRRFQSRDWRKEYDAVASQDKFAVPWQRV